MTTDEKTLVLKLLWKSRQAAEAMSISERTLWKLTDEGKMPCVRIGRSVRYDPADIHAWIVAQKTACAFSDTEPDLT